MKRDKLKARLAALLAVFNLASCLVGTYAWFVAAKVNDASNMQIQMYTHELDMSYRVYKYDDDLEEAINVTGEPDELVLKEFDSVIRERNTNTSIILEFLITGMSLGENIPIHINTTCRETDPDEHALSNIIKLQFAPINSITTTDANEKYNQAVNYFDENSIPEITFKTGSNKVTSVTYDLANYSSSIIGGTLNLYIKLDYSESLVDDFTGTFVFDGSSSNSFDQDLTAIECTTDEED